MGVFFLRTEYNAFYLKHIVNRVILWVIANLEIYRSWASSVVLENVFLIYEAEESWINLVGHICHCIYMPFEKHLNMDYKTTIVVTIVVYIVEGDEIKLTVKLVTTQVLNA